MLNLAEKRRRFTLFNYTLDGKGVPKDQNEERNFKFFFKLLGRNMSRMLSINMLILFSNFPIFFLLLGASQNLNTTSYSPISQYFGPLYGSIKMGGLNSPLTSAVMGVHGLQTEISVNTTATYVMYALGALIIFTFGLSMVGTTYITRNIVKGDPIFLMHDFFYAIKRNWKQGLIFGVLDVLFSFLIIYDILFFMANATSFATSAMFWASVFIGVIYLVMRFYIYVMMITFDLSLYKLLKNAFIFSVVGIKRNILGLLGIVALIFINYSMLLVFIPIGIILPFMLTLAIGQFIAIYTSWPKIYSVMIEPYEEEKEEVTEQPIFRDRG